MQFALCPGQFQNEWTVAAAWWFQSAVGAVCADGLFSFGFSGMSVYASTDRKSPWLPCNNPRFQTELKVAPGLNSMSTQQRQQCS
ncbi:hypothetical protein JZ751_014336 [Albula glossodonta]|uniref:Uncharacterized protein n=1 Tax=Albula glossodonta TaxID=121402 RepID=A0A8T2NSL5_9TELE|nr:hypothetical protein JZ751_014336 [Albula glossodonta]